MNVGQMVLWRYKPEINKGTLTWVFGFVAQYDSGLYRMGYYNGDYHANRWVSESEVEYKPYPSR